MKIHVRFWLFVALAFVIILAVVTGTALWLWGQRTPEEQAVLETIFRQDFVYIFGFFIFLLGGAGVVLDGIFNSYVIPLKKTAEEITLINSVNPSHRIALGGGELVTRIVSAVNDLAGRFEELHQGVEQKIYAARAEIEDEKNTLAAFISQLPEGVMVCNADGRVALYNQQAVRLLSGEKKTCAADETDHAGYIGLGRSIFGIIEKNLIVHALDEASGKLKRKETNPTAHFMVRRDENRLLHAELVPVLNHMGRFTGFILILSDITRRIETDGRIKAAMKSLTTGLRSSVAGVRSAIESIMEFPDMPPDQLRRFNDIIHKESMSLAKALDDAAVQDVCRQDTPWPLINAPAREFLETLKRKAEEKLAVRATIQQTAENAWVRVDTYSMTLAVLFIMERIRSETGVADFSFRLRAQKDRFVTLDLLWEGRPIETGVMRQWKDQTPAVGEEAFPVPLQDVIRQHEGEIWSYTSREAGKAYIRLLLPSADACRADDFRNLTILPGSRPEFYEFDLFHQEGQNPEVDARLLSDLTYTVFDTETTGLDPRGGDEIISIGAVRIINGRLLKEEYFDQLINPMRSVPAESIRIHGITPDMLADQPAIDQALPRFHDFARNTVLLGHNVAFDMRMLEMKEASVGVKFDNPVLDTLLLSAAVHPAQQDHNMESIAKRFGVNIMGRHTALGDAITTGEIFLKMSPLLAKQGIHTLKDARLASQKTYYARLKY